jgi:8-oxo-dGTP diphosphatase
VAERQLVVAAVLVDSLSTPERVLAARRSSPPALAGRWEFPGGKVEDGEEPRSALRRELTEELQITVTLGDEVLGPEGGAWPISAAFEMRTWLGTIAAGSVSPTGSHDEVRWVTRTELLELEWLDADLPIAEALVERLQAGRR